MPFFLLNYLRVSVPLWLDLLQKLNRPPIPGRTDGRFLETCLQVLLAKHLATAHRPTVPPSGERTVIAVAIAVALTVHSSSRLASGQAPGQLSSGFGDGQA